MARNAEQVLKLFEHQEDLYFQERRADIGFVVDRVMRNLLGADQPNLDHVMPGSVVVAKDLSPADMAMSAGDKSLATTTLPGMTWSRLG